MTNPWTSEERKRVLTLIVRANAMAEDLMAETATSARRPSLARYRQERTEFVAWVMAQGRKDDDSSGN